MHLYPASASHRQRVQYPRKRQSRLPMAEKREVWGEGGRMLERRWGVPGRECWGRRCWGDCTEYGVLGCGEKPVLVAGRARGKPGAQRGWRWALLDCRRQGLQGSSAFEKAGCSQRKKTAAKRGQKSGEPPLGIKTKKICSGHMSKVSQDIHNRTVPTTWVGRSAVAARAALINTHRGK